MAGWQHTGDTRGRRRGGSPGVGLVVGALAAALLVALLAASLLGSLLTRLQPRPADPGVASPEPVVTAPAPAATEIPALEQGLPERTWPALPAPTATDAAGRILQRSALYEVAAPAQAGCPAPASAGSMAELAELAGGQLDCLQEAWAPELAALGLDATEIPYYFYDADGVETPCGWVEAPALYCSAQGGAIYFGVTALNGASWYDLGVKEIAGHEYGHHLQALVGMMEASAALTGNEPVRRLELQATCFAYAQIARDDSVDLTREAFDAIEPYLRATVDDGVHGSPDSVAYWGLRGLYADDLGECNTWVVPSADVD